MVRLHLHRLPACPGGEGENPRLRPRKWWATSYLLGVSTRRMEKLAASLGVTGLSKSQVSLMAAELDELVESFRSRPLDRVHG